jgi:type II secretory ATPase GspE/PulE/Tfp pilus assembly ATPase PilB-like protein
MSMIEKLNLYEDFGAAPQDIQSMVKVHVDRDESGNDVIVLMHSSHLPKESRKLLNYMKTMERVAAIKFPTAEFVCREVSPEEFSNTETTQVEEEVSKAQSQLLEVINRVAKFRASDIHIDTNEFDTRLRVRVNGDLIQYGSLEKPVGRTLCAVVYNTMCDVAESMYMEYERQDALFTKRFISKSLSGIRVTCGPGLHGPYMVLRLLYKENISIQGLDDSTPVSFVSSALARLGYIKEQISDLTMVMMQPSGIVFTSGPTGSGKSTTLKYIIQGLARDTTRNVISVEDPPEYNISGVRQMPALVRSDNEARSEAFSQAIRSALRSDPDVIMIGEIRDTASGIMAITCAQTGHQVWTTIHANGTFSILSRMLALLVGPECSERQAKDILSDPMIVSGLMFQRLVPLSCHHCRVPLKDNFDRLSPLEYHALERAYREEFMVTAGLDGIESESATARNIRDNLAERVFLRRARKGDEPRCEHCSDGVTGRQVVSEFVHTTERVLSDAFEISIQKARRRWIGKHPNETLQANARKLVINGALDPRVAMACVGALDADVDMRDPCGC